MWQGFHVQPLKISVIGDFSSNCRLRHKIRFVYFPSAEPSGKWMLTGSPWIHFEKSEFESMPIWKCHTLKYDDVGNKMVLSWQLEQFSQIMLVASSQYFPSMFAICFISTFHFASSSFMCVTLDYRVVVHSFFFFIRNL